MATTTDYFLLLANQLQQASSKLGAASSSRFISGLHEHFEGIEQGQPEALMRLHCHAIRHADEIRGETDQLNDLIALIRQNSDRYNAMACEYQGRREMENIKYSARR